MSFSPESLAVGADPGLPLAIGIRELNSLEVSRVYTLCLFEQ